MKKIVGLIIPCIMLISILSACTDNGDDTPVEVKLEVEQQGIIDPASKVDYMLKQV